jgi:hypothetical protein
MALYIPAGRRRRRLIIGIGAAMIAGLVVGGLIGRATAPTVDDRISDVRARATAATARLDALPIEYEKELTGNQQFAKGGGVADALVQTRRDLDAAASDAPWVSSAQTNELHAAIDGSRNAARGRVAAAAFEQQLKEAETTIGAVFGLPGSSP